MTTDPERTTEPTTPTDPGTTTTYPVTGMTCEHCVAAVTEELSALDGVRRVEVALDAGGTSTVTVVSAAPLTDAQVSAALDEAGDYRLSS